MKKILLILCFMFASICAQAGSADYNYCKTMKAQTISSFTWTQIPTTNDDSRIAIWIDLPAATTNTFNLLVSSYQTPGEPTTYGYTYREGDAPWILGINREIFLYGIYNGVGGVNGTLYYQELEYRGW
jgi:hypothetical protein